MSAKGVMISYSLASPKDPVNKRSSTFTSSGICFGEKWVLTHGNIFYALKVVEDILRHQENAPKFKRNSKYQFFPNVYITMEDETDQTNFLNNITVKKGKVVYIWRCPLLTHAVDTILSSWTIGVEDNTCANQNEKGKSLFPVFALIEIGDNKSSKVNVKNCLSELYKLLIKRPPIRGEELELESTPFGNEIFINSRTSGVICNTVGLDNCLVLCDASATLHCEGGPAFTTYEKALFGIIANSLSWWRGEWVGLTLVAYLAPILHNHLFHDNFDPSLQLYMPIKHLAISNLLDNVDSVIVQIKCGPSWGSGISVGNKYILTCAHVVKEYSNHDVIVYCKGQNTKAKILYKSSKYQAYDLALLYVIFNDLPLKTVKFPTRPAVKGERVVAIGYPYFDSNFIENVKPTITKGVVNNVNPYGIQTSCCIQSGYSGGAIMRFYKPIGTETIESELLGIIVCNSKDEDNNVTYPNVNLSIPIHTIQKPLQDFIERNFHSKSLNIEGDTNQIVKSFWNFQLQKSLL